MQRIVTLLSLIVVFSMLLLASCSNANKPATSGNMPTEQTSNPSVSTSESVPTQKDVYNTENIVSQVKFSSTEEAYYIKYVELAEKYGSYSLYDYYKTKDSYDERSYLNGVCVVNLMDFNGDGIQDLFMVYSNGQMNKTVYDGFDLEIYDFPAKNTYEIEIWTYKDGELTQLLHEPYVSTCYIYPNDKSDFFLKYYRVFITVFENGNNFPIIQIYDESDEVRKYTNIHYSDGQIIRDELTCNGNGFQMNDLEITEDIWSKNIAGYNRILLCSLLADSSNSSSSLFDGYNIDYNNTLLQSERVIRYLSKEDRTPIIPKFYIAEGKYISLYLQELERSNRIRLEPEFTENHYYNLYDMDQNGVPELILYEGSSGAGTHYHFYTVIDNEVIDCGFYGRTTLLANGEGGLIAYFGRMGGFDIKKITLNFDSVLFTDIADGQVTGDTPYPELYEFGYDGYEYLAFCPPFIPFSLYTYNQNLSKY